MFIKTNSEYYRLGCGKKTLKFLAKITRCRQGSTYSRMEDGGCDVPRQAEEASKGKARWHQTLPGKEVKEKESKKSGWKRVRQAALASCRYIGMGAVHLSPASMYPCPEYSIDPKYWNRSFSSSYRPKPQPQAPHWTSNMMYSTW